eukprot:510957-Heterocapsa_arctica.AAC.2
MPGDERPAADAGVDARVSPTPNTLDLCSPTAASTSSSRHAAACSSNLMMFTAASGRTSVSGSYPAPAPAPLHLLLPATSAWWPG